VAYALLLPVFMSRAIAQNMPVSKPLTLTEAIQIAVVENPEVKAAGFYVDSMESRANQARSGFFPQIHFTETFSRTNNPMWSFGAKLNQNTITQSDFDIERLKDPDAVNNFALAVSASWSVYNGGRTKISWDQAKYNHSAASLEYAGILQEIIARTATAYVGLLLAKEDLVVVEQTLESARANLKMVQSRFNSGFVVKSDLLRARVRIAEIEQQHFQSESQIIVARSLLNTSMGLTENRPINLVTPFRKCIEIAGTVEDWTHTAFAKRPDLEKMRYQEKIAEQEVRKSRAGHLPALQIVGNYEIDSKNFSNSADNYNIGALMRMNLFSGYGISAKINASKSSLEQIREIRKGMELGAGVQVREAFLMARSAWKSIDVARSAMEQAEEGLRIVKNRYNNGLLTIVALLDAEVARQRAYTRYFKSLHNFKVARIKLFLASGTIDADFQ